MLIGTFFIFRASERQKFTFVSEENEKDLAAVAVWVFFI